jgi:hypothetical protein
MFSVSNDLRRWFHGHGTLHRRTHKDVDFRQQCDRYRWQVEHTTICMAECHGPYRHYEHTAERFLALFGISCTLI